MRYVWPSKAVNLDAKYIWNQLTCSSVTVPSRTSIPSGSLSSSSSSMLVSRIPPNRPTKMYRVRTKAYRAPGVSKVQSVRLNIPRGQSNNGAFPDQRDMIITEPTTLKSRFEQLLSLRVSLPTLAAIIHQCYHGMHHCASTREAARKRACPGNTAPVSSATPQTQ